MAKFTIDASYDPKNVDAYKDFVRDFAARICRSLCIPKDSIEIEFYYAIDPVKRSETGDSSEQQKA